MNKKLFLSTALICVFCGSLFAAEVVDSIVAIVNDDIITSSELRQSMLPFVADYKVRYGDEFPEKLDEAREDALNRLIEEKLILQEAKNRAIEVDEAEIESRLDMVKSRAPSEEEFNQMLDSSGLTVAKLKERYQEQIMMKHLVNQVVATGVRISPTVIAAYYYGHREDFELPRKVNFGVLLLKPLSSRGMDQTERLAERLLARIRAGESFEYVVKQYSQGPNKENGGEMGYVREDGLLDEIKAVIDDMQPGDISPLVKTSTGFHIIKLIDIQESEIKSLEDVSDAIRERLFQRDAELVLREFVNKLREDAYIEIK
ncbi:MAG: peptidylprolyl isomerase [Candidatus Omnitrophota bacterium]